MTIENTGTPARQPVHPGEVFREEFLVPLGQTAADVRGRSDLITAAELEELVEERLHVTPRIAQALEVITGSSAQMWINLQERRDDYSRALASRVEHKG
jgi:addiction module HigA family antidote